MTYQNTTKEQMKIMIEICKILQKSIIINGGVFNVDRYIGTQINRSNLGFLKR